VSIEKKYTVCHLLYEEYPRDPRVRRYVNALNESDRGAVIICSKKKDDKYFEETGLNLIYRVPVSKKRASFFITLLEYIAFTNISAAMLIYLGIKYRFRIIHVHTLPDFLVFAAIWNKIFGAKIILDLHEIFPELYIARTGAGGNSFKVKVLKFSEKISIWLANTVITIHENARDIFVSRNKGLDNKIHVVMNSVDPAEFENSSLIKTKDFIITYNGTVVKLLNLTMIVEALAEVKKKMPAEDFKRIEFRIYGDGPALDDILMRAVSLGVSEKVNYMGFLEPQEMRREVLKTSVLILPPLKNIYSDLFYTIKLIEAVYLKIPVIATRLNTYMRYYGEDSLFYFESGNLEDLTGKIEEVFYNKELVQKKTMNSFADYQKVNWDIMKEKYLKIVDQIMGK
jgi:glycosyltransferase involved in cell wall biosynthesis